MSGPHVGFVADEPLPAWVARAASLVAASPLAGRTSVLTLPRRETAGRALRAYLRADRRLFAGPPDALAPAGAGDLGAATAEPVPPERLAARIERLGLDVVVNASGRWLEPGDAGPRAELWELRHGSALAGAGHALLREFAAGSASCDSTLVRRGHDGESVLYASRSALRRLSLQRTRSPVCWKSATFAARALELAARGCAQPCAPAPAAGGADEIPGALEVARLQLRLARRALGYLGERLLHRWSWSIVWQERAAPATAPEEFRPAGALTPERGRFYADPFLAAAGGRHYLFYEDFRRDAGRAAISVTAIGGGEPAPGRPVVVAPYHLSYPFVFAHGGDHYMVPESAEAGVVQLLRARRFPYEWELDATLLADVRAYDSTLVRHEGLWYLFAAIAADGADADELHLFWAERLRGPYLPHALNPVVSDAGRARPAGRILRDGARLLRPGQDCSRGYGSALVLSEIATLTPSAYAERPLARIEPTWAPGARGTHTLDHDGALQVMDVKRLAPRWARGALPEAG